MPDWVRTHVPEEPVVLDGEEFVKSLRNSRRGAAPGPSGMCAEHLRPLLDRESDVMAITMFANSFARGQIPSDIVQAVRLGRMTALQKPDGGVRGIVVGDYFTRLVSRTLAKQFAQKAEDATSPFQCECVAHMVQAYRVHSATIVSVDGVGANDLVSRTAMLSGLMDMEEGDRLLPFVRLFYSDPSTFLWDDAVGDTHEIRQGEGVEQGNALMPLLFSLGQWPDVWRKESVCLHFWTICT